MQIEKVKISDLSPAEYNPRVRLRPGDAEYEKLKRSIQTFGYIDPIIINADGTIIGGHQRYFILQELGYEEIDVVKLNLDEKDERALNVALNKISGDWDEEKLKDLLKGLKLDDYDFTVTGFEESELDSLVANLEIPETAEDDDFDAEGEYDGIEQPKTQRGDIYILGNHRLMCGDSTDPTEVDTLLNGESADLIVTDPPYNVNYGDKAEYLEEYLGKGHRNQKRIKNDNMDSLSFYHFLLDSFLSAYSALRPGGAIYVFHAETEGQNFRTAFTDAGLKLAQVLIWEKNSFVLGRQDYQWRHEPILYGWKEGAAHYFINDRTQDTVILEDEIDYKHMTKQELIAYVDELHRGLADKTSVLYENKPARNDIHPTMKPITLIGKLIKNSSRINEKVLDLFGGSGSMLIAAEQLKRRAYIMELDEKFCDVIVKRWEDFTGEKAVKVKC